MVYGAVPVKDEENPLLGVRSSSKRPRSFAYGVIAVVCVAALAISGVSRATDESSREDHLSALGDLSNDYLAKRSWWQDVKTANETLITAKQASDKAMEAAAEAEEKVDELVLDAEEKDRMCTDIHKAEDQTSGCDDHCSTGAVQASRLGWGSWSRSASRSVSSWSWSVSSWWRSIRQRAAEAAKKAAEAKKKKAKCMETCKSLKCGLPQCKKAPDHSTCPPKYSSKDYWCTAGFHLWATNPYASLTPGRRSYWNVGFVKINDSRLKECKLGVFCSKYQWKFYFPGRKLGYDKCTQTVELQLQALSGHAMGGKRWEKLGIGSDYLSECGKCTD